MNMNQRKIIEILLNENDSVSSLKLAEQLQVSQRSVKRYMKEMPVEMAGVSLVILADRNGYYIESSQKKRMQILEKLQLLEGENTEKNIFLYLFLYDEATIDEVADYLYFSKTSIIKKIESLKVQAAAFEVQIQASTKGLSLKGTSNNIRKAAVSFLQLDDNLQQAILNKFFQVIDIVNEIQQIVINELIRSETTIAKELLQLIIKNIILSLAKPAFFEQEEYADKPLVYKNFIVVTNIAKNLEERFRLKLSEPDLFYLSILFGTTTFSKNKLREIRLAILDSLEELEAQYNENFLVHAKFLVNLQNHFLACVQRLAINASIQNPLRDVIKERYFLAFEYATFFTKKMEQFLSVEFSVDEISYLALHFQTYLEGKKAEELFKVLVVCENGVGTSSLVQMQLESKLSNIKVDKIIPRYLISKQDFSEIDFVVSTTHINEEITKEVIYVNPVLMEEDFERIKSHTRSLISTNYLLELFHEGLFFLDVNCQNKKELLQFVTTILIDKKLMTKNQQEAMIERETFSPTDIIPGVAMPHYIVKSKSFLCFVRLSQPIKWETEMVSYILLGGINVEEKESKNIFPYLIKLFRDSEKKARIESVKYFEELRMIIKES